MFIGGLSRTFILVAALLMLGLAGLGLRPVERILRSRREAADAWPRESPGALSLAAVLGGFRAVAADLAWVHTHAAWEREDVAGTWAGCRRTVALDPRPLYFWINGARLLAYDVPVWRIRAGGERMPVAERARIAQEQVTLALQHLENARRQHPARAAVLLEMGHLHLYGRGDLAAAADAYGEAADLPDAPLYAARLQAALLARLGRLEEAYTRLKAHHRALGMAPEGADPNLVAGVEARLEKLELELGIAANERVTP